MKKLLLLFVALIIFSSCKKDDPPPPTLFEQLIKDDTGYNNSWGFHRLSITYPGGELSDECFACAGSNSITFNSGCTTWNEVCDCRIKFFDQLAGVVLGSDVGDTIEENNLAELLIANPNFSPIGFYDCNMEKELVDTEEDENHGDDEYAIFNVSGNSLYVLPDWWDKSSEENIFDINLFTVDDSNPDKEPRTYLHLTINFSTPNDGGLYGDFSPYPFTATYEFHEDDCFLGVTHYIDESIICDNN